MATRTFGPLLGQSAGDLLRRQVGQLAHVGSASTLSTPPRGRPPSTRRESPRTPPAEPPAPEAAPQRPPAFVRAPTRPRTERRNASARPGPRGASRRRSRRLEHGHGGGPGARRRHSPSASPSRSSQMASGQLRTLRRRREPIGSVRPMGVAVQEYSRSQVKRAGKSWARALRAVSDAEPDSVEAATQALREFYGTTTWVSCRRPRRSTGGATSTPIPCAWRTRASATTPAPMSPSASSGLGRWSTSSAGTPPCRSPRWRTSGASERSSRTRPTPTEPSVA